MLGFKTSTSLASSPNRITKLQEVNWATVKGGASDPRRVLKAPDQIRHESIPEDEVFTADLDPSTTDAQY
jgi:hypothetical protein